MCRFFEGTRLLWLSKWNRKERLHFEGFRENKSAPNWLKHTNNIQTAARDSVDGPCLQMALIHPSRPARCRCPGCWRSQRSCPRVSPSRATNVANRVLTNTFGSCHLAGKIGPQQKKVSVFSGEWKTEGDPLFLLVEYLFCLGPQKSKQRKRGS